MRKLMLLSICSVLLISCNNFGKKEANGHVEVYYQENIQKSEAEKTASVLMNLENSAGRNEGTTKSFQLSNEGGILLIKMVADEKRAKDIADISFLAIATIISDSVFQGRPLNIELTDNKFKTFKHLDYKKITNEMTTQDFGKKYTVGNVELFVKNDLSESEAEKLAIYLNTIMQPAQTISFQALQNKENVFTLRMASDREKVSSVPDQTFISIANTISEKCLQGQPLVYELATTDFTPFKSFKSN